VRLLWLLRFHRKLASIAIRLLSSSTCRTLGGLQAPPALAAHCERITGNPESIGHFRIDDNPGISPNQDSSIIARAACQTLSKPSKFEPEFSCEAAAIADWASKSSIAPKLNSNIRDFLN